MATYTANIATTQTLSANTVDTVTLTSPATRVTVTCSSAVGAGTIYFTVGSGSATTPTVGGSNAYAVVAGSSFTVDFDGSFPTVKLISSAALTYTVAAASVFNKLADNTVDNATLQIANNVVSVKDGGIGTTQLSTAVNTSLTNSGLVYVKQQTIGTGVSSVTVTDAFSSSYENYKIVVNGGISNTAQAITLKLGSSTSGYSYNTLIYNYATGGATVLNSNSASVFDYAGEANTNFLNVCLDILSPNLAKYTTIQGSYIGENSGGTAAGVHKVATAYTSFTLAVAGTVTGGTIRIYGYRQA
jgi:hypothetical protein